MKQSFADFVATEQQRMNDTDNVLRYSEMLCEALLTDFNRQHKRSNPYKFYIESGRKYHKLIMETESGSRSVHAFVDKKTGEVYKPASFKAPAKHVRFNLLVIKEREWLLEHADWAGGYLYKR